ncbi:hypothetical protein FRC12_003100 [Ceratobasidium sp. 428]|nr:hypothetical protein FRC09_005311 [Ceratobasidium sp. 395]KAG8793309.1 hypothetical protein FRC12_003100 [Ceratobasidium sp. 428]
MVNMPPCLKINSTTSTVVEPFLIYHTVGLYETGRHLPEGHHMPAPSADDLAFRAGLINTSTDSRVLLNYSDIDPVYHYNKECTTDRLNTPEPWLDRLVHTAQRTYYGYDNGSDSIPLIADDWDAKPEPDWPSKPISGMLQGGPVTWPDQGWGMGASAPRRP